MGMNTLESEEVSEAMGYFWHPCCHTRQSMKHSDQTTVLSCCPSGIWESGFTLWTLGVNYSQAWVSHAYRWHQQKAVNRPRTVAKAAVTPLRTMGNQDAIQNIDAGLNIRRLVQQWHLYEMDKKWNGKESALSANVRNQGVHVCVHTGCSWL